MCPQREATASSRQHCLVAGSRSWQCGPHCFVVASACGRWPVFGCQLPTASLQLHPSRPARLVASSVGEAFQCPQLLDWRRAACCWPGSGNHFLAVTHLQPSPLLATSAWPLSFIGPAEGKRISTELSYQWHGGGLFVTPMSGRKPFIDLLAICL